MRNVYIYVRVSWCGWGLPRRFVDINSFLFQKGSDSGEAVTQSLVFIFELLDSRRHFVHRLFFRPQFFVQVHPHCRSNYTHTHTMMTVINQESTGALAGREVRV